MSLAPYVHLDEPLDAAARGDRVALPADAAHHLRRVLRLSDGADVEVADGRGVQAHGQLAGDAVVLVGAPVGSSPPVPALTVAQALAKGRKLDEVVRQVTELGVDRIVPVAAARSVVQLTGDRADRAVERWSAVARSASEQARRPWRPEVTPVTTTSRLPAVAGAGHLVVAHPGGTASLVEVAGRAAVDGTAVTVAIGPEGGWSDAEVEALVDAGGQVVGLGPTVLRTEHAAAAALAVLAAAAGRWA